MQTRGAGLAAYAPVQSVSRNESRTEMKTFAQRATGSSRYVTSGFPLLSHSGDSTCPSRDVVPLLPRSSDSLLRESEKRHSLTKKKCDLHRFQPVIGFPLTDESSEVSAAKGLEPQRCLPHASLDVKDFLLGLVKLSSLLCAVCCTAALYSSPRCPSDWVVCGGTFFFSFFLFLSRVSLPCVL